MHSALVEANDRSLSSLARGLAVCLCSRSVLRFALCALALRSALVVLCSLLLSLDAAAGPAGVSWVLIYRTDEYKKLQKSVDVLTAKLEKVKGEKESAGLSGSGSGSGEARAAKKVALVDEQLQARGRELSMSKMKSTVVVGLILLGVFGFINQLFEGQAVARLPFEPFGLLQSMTHRGLPGSDSADCSSTFIYILCSISIRASVQKALGFTPKNAGPSMFQTPSQ